MRVGRPGAHHELSGGVDLGPDHCGTYYGPACDHSGATDNIVHGTDYDEPSSYDDHDPANHDHDYDHHHHNDNNDAAAAASLRRLDQAGERAW